MFIVQNGKTWGFTGRDKIYIGRANGKLEGSPLANPFVVGRDGDRTEVIEKCRKWLWEQIKKWIETGEMTDAVIAIKSIAVDVAEGKRVILTCWCKPEACHGDVIVACVNWIIKEGLV
jgi:hypothetical protein